VTIGEECDEDGRPRRLIAERDTYKFAAANDLAYNMMRMWQGAVGLVPVDGLVSPAYVVARPLAGVNAKYFELLFRTNAYMNEVNRNSRGIVSDRNRLYWDDFKRMPSPVPPKPEQDSIVNFVNFETASMDAAIEKTHREIDLLREYRTRLIADVVTGKLDVRGVELPEMGDEEAAEVLGEDEDGDLAEEGDAGEDEEAEV
jgi:type I restriction enzyme S subunit